MFLSVSMQDLKLPIKSIKFGKVSIMNETDNLCWTLQSNKAGRTK